MSTSPSKHLERWAPWGLLLLVLLIILRRRASNLTPIHAAKVAGALFFATCATMSAPSRMPAKVARKLAPATKAAAGASSTDARRSRQSVISRRSLRA